MSAWWLQYRLAETALILGTFALATTLTGPETFFLVLGMVYVLVRLEAWLQVQPMSDSRKHSDTDRWARRRAG